MATTWIKAIHRTNSGSISAAIKSTVEYAANHDKTQGGELIATFECSPETVLSEFMLSKKLYERQTGRNQGKHDVIGYQIWQSFKPGEVTAQQALDLGYELAMRWTRGKHQFIVAAHINTDNPHTHIFFNSVTLDHDRKFQDFKRSAIALRRVSDILCVEHGLSIIEKPKLSKGYNRAEYLGSRKPPTGREKLQDIIDDVLCVGKSFPDFLVALRRAGCEIKIGKQPSIKPPGSKKYFRMDTLGEDYTEAAIRERLSGKRDVVKRSASDGAAERKTAEYAASQYRPTLLIDIEEKLQRGYGAGFEQYAKIQNLKEAAKTLIFLRDNGIGTYEELVKKESDISVDYYKMNERRKEIDTRLSSITELQKYVGQYGKSRDIWAAYKRSGYDQSFVEANRAELTLHKAAKNNFDEQGFKTKLPSINTLKQEYATLLAEKKSLGNIKAAREEMIDWSRAKHNVDLILGERPAPQKSRNREAR